MGLFSRWRRTDRRRKQEEQRQRERIALGSPQAEGLGVIDPVMPVFIDLDTLPGASYADDVGSKITSSSD
jgi:hypothetical protein